MTKYYNNINEVIEMAWCDKASFDNIYSITGLSEADVIKVMRQHLKPSSFRLWRKRVSGRILKHKQRIERKSILQRTEPSL